MTGTTNPTCPTCAKRWPAHSRAAGCKVLTDRIGESGPCWAYSDDPEWEHQIYLAIRRCYGPAAAYAAYIEHPQIRQWAAEATKAAKWRVRRAG